MSGPHSQETVAKKQCAENAYCNRFPRWILPAREKQIKRRWMIRRLKRQGSVSIEDISGLDYLGQFAIADQLWPLCGKVVRQALMNNGHHFVRSAAIVAAREQGL